MVGGEICVVCIVCVVVYCVLVCEYMFVLGVR